VFRCEGCLVVLDRDINAARNILAAGRAVTAVEPKWDRPGTSR
jgi:transposase